MKVRGSRTRGKMVLTIFVLSLLVSCKSAKETEGSLAYLPARTVVKKNSQASFSGDRIKASMGIKYRGSDELPNITGSMRMVRDSMIWISFSKLGFPIAKLRITPDEVAFYEKVSKTWFKGDFQLISTWLGTDFDFEMVQNLFLGESLVNLEKNKYVSSVVNRQYLLQPKKTNPLFELLILIDPDHFKVAKEELRDLNKSQKLTILYKNYDHVSESLFPKGFMITAVGEKSKTVIDVTYRNVQLDTPLKFPFQMPEGYRKIELE